MVLSNKKRKLSANNQNIERVSLSLYLVYMLHKNFFAYPAHEDFLLTMKQLWNVFDKYNNNAT